MGILQRERQTIEERTQCKTPQRFPQIQFRFSNQKLSHRHPQVAIFTLFCSISIYLHEQVIRSNKPQLIPLKMKFVYDGFSDDSDSPSVSLPLSVINPFGAATPYFRRFPIQRALIRIREVDLQFFAKPLVSAPAKDLITQLYQDAFPPGGDCSGLVVILEQCVRTFWHEEHYKNDIRYLKVWLEYAGYCDDAEVVYSFLDTNKIDEIHFSILIQVRLNQSIFMVIVRPIVRKSDQQEKRLWNYAKFMWNQVVFLPPTSKDRLTIRNEEFEKDRL